MSGVLDLKEDPVNRYKECGLESLSDRSKRLVRFGNQLPFQVEKAILGIKQDKPYWGARKIRDRLVRKYPEIKTPSISTIHAGKHSTAIPLLSPTKQLAISLLVNLLKYQRKVRLYYI